MRFLIFIALCVLPLFAHRQMQKRADRIRNAQLKLGRIEKNPGARKRIWQAKMATARLWTAVALCLGLPLMWFVSQLDGFLFVTVIVGLVSLAISHAFEKPIYDYLDRRATNEQLDKLEGFDLPTPEPAPSSGITFDSAIWLNSSKGFTEPVAPLVPAGQQGTARLARGEDTDMVDHVGTAEARKGGR